MSGIEPITVYHFDDERFRMRADAYYPDEVLDEMARRVGDNLDHEVLARLGYVKVVRCRECKHFDQHYTDGALFDETVCWSWDNGHDYPHYTSPDGFCYRGERKEDE